MSGYEILPALRIVSLVVSALFIKDTVLYLGIVN